MSEQSAQWICGCGHRVSDHNATRCLETWRPPDVLNARACGCKGVWKPGPEDSRYQRWRDRERRALREEQR